MNHLRPLTTLIEVTEDRYHIPRGDMVAGGRHQPIVSIKMLAVLVAYDAEFSYAQIGRVFHMDPKTAANAVKVAREHTTRGQGWWLYGKADLYDAWQEALERG